MMRLGDATSIVVSSTASFPPPKVDTEIIYSFAVLRNLGAVAVLKCTPKNKKKAALRNVCELHAVPK